MSAGFVFDRPVWDSIGIIGENPARMVFGRDRFEEKAVLRFELESIPFLASLNPLTRFEKKTVLLFELESTSKY